jgi:LacI family transcriptional regulator
MTNSVSLKQLADELNLSTASVSRALNDSYEISTATKERVLALAKRMNYEVNPFASNLRHVKSKTIAIIIPEIANQFFSQAINAIEEVARENGFHVLIYQTHEKSEMELSFTQRLLNGRIAGILISVSSESDISEHFSELSKKMPMVFFDRVYDNIETVKVTTNDYESSYAATQHLIDCGCRKILYCGGLTILAIGKKRLAGYTDAIKANNLVFDKKMILTMGHDGFKNSDEIKNAVSVLQPDAILSSIEEFSFPCYRVCKELGLQIPNDIKIVSFSNSDSVAFLNPPLTTVTQPAYEIGKIAAVMLFKMLNNKRNMNIAYNCELKSSLIKRASTGY